MGGIQIKTKSLDANYAPKLINLLEILNEKQSELLSLIDATRAIQIVGLSADEMYNSVIKQSINNLIKLNLWHSSH